MLIIANMMTTVDNSNSKSDNPLHCVITMG